MSKRPLLFLDTETDGLGPQRRAYEVAMVRREPDGTEREVQFFLPMDASHADPGALDIGGYYRRHPSGIAVSRIVDPASFGQAVPVPHPPLVLPLPKAAKLLAQWTHGATIVGANPAFDVQIVERMMRAHGYEPHWHDRVRNVEDMVCGITEPDMGGLAACAAAMGVKVDPALEHTAMGDVRTVMGIWDAVFLIGEQIDAVFAPVLVAEAAQDMPPVGSQGALVIQTTGLAEDDDPPSGALPHIPSREVVEVTPSVLAAAALSKARAELNARRLRKLAGH